MRYNRYPIIIVDANTYAVVKEVKEQGYIINRTSICVLNVRSFIYVRDGKVVQIGVDDEFKVLYKMKGMDELRGWNGLVSVNGGEYI